MSISGGCRCGAVRYELAIEAIPPAYACHCLQCQTWSGSAFSEQLLLREDQVSVVGPVVRYDLTTEDRTSQQRMCGTCHTRLYNTNTRRPGIAVIRAGTLDESHRIEVAAHIWVKRKQPWLALPEGARTWPEAAPLDDLAAALRPA
ncbi:GFA family protein [Sphingomonas oryzagri]|uniref:GFA family protein n=1 Tax=Sphingomonas oryzagri TaxID=3042314 RepID=A0ABT6MZL6_9SPHN|nr:GFA family protein [Sphingomonas oryzagri]MDH7638483.1 GFA family protein [Sphingomonas oryzagri]